MLAQVGVDKMVDREWIISKKGDKITSIALLIVGGIFLVFLIYLITGISLIKPTPLVIFVDMIYILLLSFTFYILKYTGNWDNPKIIKLERDKILVEETFPDGKTKKDIIPINGIKKMKITKKETILEFINMNGVTCRWYLIWKRHSKEDRKKLKEVLNEILNRVNKDEVEIIHRGQDSI